MDAKTMAIVLIPSILSFATAIISIVIGFWRDKQRKIDIAWETAREIVLHTPNTDLYIDERSAEEVTVYFQHLYKCLKAVKSEELDKLLKETEAKRLQRQVL